jgi:protein gp37
MSDKSKIEWTDATWQPITGCTILTPGCTNCYAMKLAGGRLRNHPSRKGLTKPSKNGPVWTGEVRFNEQWLMQPLSWREPRRVFVCAHGDLFHEDAPDEWIDRVFAVMALCPQHTFQVLTKRAERMRDYLTNPPDAFSVRWHHVADEALMIDPSLPTGEGGWALQLEKRWPLPNVWLGVSCERPEEDHRISSLLCTPAAIHFVSLEPLLAETWIHDYLPGGVENYPSYLDWVIVGGESGSNARPMHPQWARDIRDQCKAAGVAFFFTQWGEWEHWEETAPWNPDRGCAMTPDGRMYDDARIIRKAPVDRLFCLMQRVGKKAAGCKLDGIEHNEFPKVST